MSPSFHLRVPHDKAVDGGGMYKPVRQKECPRDVQSRYGADIGVVSGVEEQRRTTVKILQPVFKHAEYPLVRREQP
jgi:hypothetical protein